LSYAAEYSAFNVSSAAFDNSPLHAEDEHWEDVDNVKKAIEEAKKKKEKKLPLKSEVLNPKKPLILLIDVLNYVELMETILMMILTGDLLPLLT
jgi:hypothetical protein